jgi:hypothetical protein
MERFVRRENVKHYRDFLKTAKTEAERQQILKLLAEEEQKQRDAGDNIEEQGSSSGQRAPTGSSDPAKKEC